MADLKVGDMAPDFSARLPGGEDFRLSDLRGKSRLVLYFYPKDFTAGCTKEACHFRDNMEEIAKLDAKIIGVSRDSDDSHVRFGEQHDLNFPLLSDSDGTISKLYSVARLGGKLGTKRKTFVIDKEGTVRAIIHSEINMLSHIERALESLKEG